MTILGIPWTEWAWGLLTIPFTWIVVVVFIRTTLK